MLELPTPNKLLIALNAVSYTHLATGTTDKVPFERIVKIAAALGVSPTYLANGEELLQARTEDEKKVLLLARKAADIPTAQRERLLQHFEDTIDIYLKAKNVLKED